MRGKPTDNEPYPAEIRAVLAAPYGLKGFRRFCRGLGLKIHPFQAFMLALYFGGVTELVILISKKNGKTTLLAALALYHLLMTPQAECVIGASSRDQATILFNQAAGLIRTGDLERHALPGDRREPTRYAGVFEVREGYRLIRFEGGRVRVLAADADTADGVIPTLAIVDELHRHPSGALYGVFRDGLLGNAQMITISTAGASMDSPLGTLLGKARDFAAETVLRRRTYTSPDGSFVLVEWALDPEDDPHDMTVVKSVNPAPWHTVKSLRRRHDSPSTSTGQWLRFACGVWTEGEEPAITGAEWDRLVVDIGQIVDGDEVVLAPSVGHNAAIGIAAVREGERIAVRAEVIEPQEGRSILAMTEDRIVEMCDQYDVLEVRHPLGGFVRSADLLRGRVPLAEDPHSPARLTAATGTFERLRRSGNLLHDGDPVLRQHVLAARLKTSEQGERYMISDRSRAQIAVMMAVYAASATTPAPMIVLPRAVG
jgi:phage terminase large subunit-like protein